MWMPAGCGSLAAGRSAVGANIPARELVLGVPFEADWLHAIRPLPPVMSSYLLLVLSGLVLLVAAALLTGMVWERRRSRGREAALAWRDPRSGLYARVLLLELLGRQLALAARLRHPVAVLMVELDEPDHLARQHGRAYLGELQQALAQRLAERVRGYDLLGHWGDHSFLIVLPDSDVGGALVLAQDLRDGLLQRRLEIRGQTQAASVSVGVHARHPDRHENCDELAHAMATAAQRALDSTRFDGPGRVEIEP